MLEDPKKNLKIFLVTKISNQSLVYFFLFTKFLEDKRNLQTTLERRGERACRSISGTEPDCFLHQRCLCFVFFNPFLPTVLTFAVRETNVSRHNGGTSGAPLKPLRDDSTVRALSSQGFKGGTRGSPIMPRDVSLSDSKCWNGGQKWVNEHFR